MTHTFQTKFANLDEVIEHKARTGLYVQDETTIQYEIDRQHKRYKQAHDRQGYAIIAAMDGLVTVITGTNQQISGGMGHDLHESAFHAGLPVADYRDADSKQLRQILNMPYVVCNDETGEWEVENSSMPRITSVDFIKELRKIGVMVYQK